MTSVIWCLALIMSFIGWGQAVASILKLKRPDVGLLAIWGIAFTHLCFGIVAYFYPIKIEVLGPAFVLLGLVNFIFYYEKRAPEAPSWAAVFLGSLCGLRLLAALNDPVLNLYDDFLAYMPHAKMFYQTGTLLDSFGLRRLASFGGQSLLHSLLLPGASIFQLPAMDRGVMLVILVINVFFLFRWVPEYRRVWLLVCTLLVFVDHPRINLASQTSGVVMFLGLYRTLKWSMSSPITNFRSFIVLGLVAASVSSLRSHYFLATLLILGALLVLTRKVKLFVWALVFSVLFVAPWAALLHQSSGTFWFPVFQGSHFNSTYGTFHSLFPTRSLGEILKVNIIEAQLWGVALVLTVCFSLRRKILAAYALVSALLVPAFSIAMTNSSPEDVFRYIHPLFYVMVLIFVIEVPVTRSVIRLAFQAKLKSIVLLITFAWCLLNTFQNFEWIFDLPLKLRDVKDFVIGNVDRSFYETEALAYSEAQGMMREGASFISSTEKPFYFDFSRNTVFLLDIPGNVSPPPGLPEFKNTNKVDQYLRDLKIEYLVFNPPQSTHGMYSREKWSEVLGNRGRDYHREWLPYFMDLFDYLDKKSDGALYYENRLVVREL